MALRLTPLHRSANRPNLFLGGDRELVMFTGVVAFALVFAAQEWTATLFGISLWLLALYLFRLMAKSDPLMRFVYLRNRVYQPYYPARSTPFRINMRERR
ncbi:conjugal transfer protein TrbD [Methyloterricola oryzae]|uniref:conjugal transfer protein TrbD n=1 Tax=Methyloterricola oryzae TaxID=1495050 RepID=UPI0005EACC98|nr:conjugal transfer protein TrbD [Methyloterricola oryzae]